MRLLVTGGNGQLGRELNDVATNAGHVVVSTNRSTCDIADPVAVARVVDDAAPDVVVNCAAWTRVDAAEDEADAAFLANAIGPRVLAATCALRDVLLVHVSTDYVFDGTATVPIDEWQPPSPRSTYGRSKLAGEADVRALARRHQVVRTAWLYGRDGPNFALTMLRAAAAGRALRVVADQLGSPTWTGHLAPALLRLAAQGVPGTYHLTNSGVTSWHGFAAEIFAAAGVESELAPIPSSEYPTPAPRPTYSVLDNRAARLLGHPPLPAWEEGVHAYVAELRAGGRLPVAERV